MSAFILNMYCFCFWQFEITASEREGKIGMQRYSAYNSTALRCMVGCILSIIAFFWRRDYVVQIQHRI